MIKSMIVFIIAIVLLLINQNIVLGIGASYPYPIEASWFSDKYTYDEWQTNIQNFESIGGHIIWKRGRIFREISPDDLQSHPDYQWCWIQGIHCVDMVSLDAIAQQFTINKYLIYDYEENYGTSILSCPFDRIVYGSRVYQILYMAHDKFQKENPCDLQNKNVDVLFVSFSGIDSSEILFDILKSKSNFQVYLGSPYLPVQVDAPWAVDSDLLPPLFEFTKRVYNSYMQRFNKYGSIFAGIYQAFELYLGSQTLDPNALYAYDVLKQMTNTSLQGRKFVLSPYPVANKDFSSDSLEQHATNFNILAQVCDIIAIQEGRGCGNSAYYEPFQLQTPIQQVDPVLQQIISYRQPVQPSSPTFADKFNFRAQDLFQAFYNQIISLGDKAPQLWLNVEAFEYLRDDPCLPVDTIGNGMAELLDRSNKKRIDWALQSQSAYVSGIISFAWNSDYTCTTNNYSTPIYQEIQNDYGRPILAQVVIPNDECDQVSVRGFNIADLQTNFSVGWTDSQGSQHSSSFTPSSVDPQWGQENNRSYLMGQAVLNTGWQCSDLCPTCQVEFYANNTFGQSNHPFYGYIQTSKLIS